MAKNDGDTKPGNTSAVEETGLSTGQKPVNLSVIGLDSCVKPGGLFMGPGFLVLRDSCHITGEMRAYEHHRTASGHHQ